MQMLNVNSKVASNIEFEVEYAYFHIIMIQVYTTQRGWKWGHLQLHACQKTNSEAYTYMATYSIPYLAELL